MKSILSFLKKSLENKDIIGEIINTRTDLSETVRKLLKKQVQTAGGLGFGEQEIKAQEDWGMIGRDNNLKTGIVLGFDKWNEYKEILEGLLKDRQNIYLIFYGNPYSSLTGYNSNDDNIQIPTGERMTFISRNFQQNKDIQFQEANEIIANFRKMIEPAVSK